MGAQKRNFVLFLLIALLCGGRAYADEDLTLRFGMSAAFSGPSRGLGIELYRGASAYFDFINSKGGVYGRRLELLALDDGYNPLPTIANTINFIEQENVFALFSYVGTPTVTRILPLLIKYKQHHIYLMFPFTGAEPQRHPPYNDYVFNLRASYMQETEAVVDKFMELGRKRIGVFYQADAYGRGGWDGVRKALSKYGLKPVIDVSYPRGSGRTYSYAEQARLLHEAGVDAIISVGTYASSAGFIRDLRETDDDALVACVSFSDGDNLVRILQEMGDDGGKDYTKDLINIQVVPCYEDTSFPAVQEYRFLMDAYSKELPLRLGTEPYTSRHYSAVSFEGYLNARMLVEMLWRLGEHPDRSRIPQVMNSITYLDLGIKVPVHFGPDMHQGMDSVYFMSLSGGRHIQVTDWSRWHK